MVKAQERTKESAYQFHATEQSLPSSSFEVFLMICESDSNNLI